MSELIIRPERPEDYRETELMAQRAFWNLHGRGCDEHLLVHNLRQDGNYVPELSRVAELDGRIVGCIMYARAYLHAGDTVHEVLTFGPLCVDMAAQCTGVGSTLLRETLALAKQTDYAGIIIFGEADYYPRFGFKTCDNYGITDWDGGNSEAFMGLELREGALNAIGGRFREADVYDDLGDIEEFSRDFPRYPALSLPLQWGYDGEDWKHYRMTDARQNRSSYRAMFNRYVLELGNYLPGLLENVSENGDFLPEETAQCFASPSKRPYVITKDGEPIGLAVLSGPGPEDEPDGCTHYVEEMYVVPEFRRRGIAADIALRYMRQNEGACGLCVAKGSEGALAFWKRTAEKGGYSMETAEDGDYLWCVLSKE